MNHVNYSNFRIVQLNLFQNMSWDQVHQQIILYVQVCFIFLSNKFKVGCGFQLTQLVKSLTVE